jgi:sugar (pentulose or hexulose) kinase
MDSAPALLAIDLGTSSVKVIVTNLAGTILGAGSGDYPIDQPQPGWAEQEPERWWSQSCAATRQALATAHIAPASIAAIGLSGQMHGTVMLDEQERLIRPAVIWPDRRSAQQVTEFTDQIGAEQLLAIAGSPLATGFLAATVRWFQQKEPATWDRVRTLLLPKDWLRWRMTGAFGRPRCWRRWNWTHPCCLRCCRQLPKPASSQPRRRRNWVYRAVSRLSPAAATRPAAPWEPGRCSPASCF